MRLAALFLASALLPLGAAAQSADPTPEQEAAYDACVAAVDTEAADAFAEELLERSGETMDMIDEACAAGRQGDAAKLYAPVWAEYISNPDVKKLLSCDAKLGGPAEEAFRMPNPCEGE